LSGNTYSILPKVRFFFDGNLGVMTAEPNQEPSGHSKVMLIKMRDKPLPSGMGKDSADGRAVPAFARSQ